MSLGLVLSGGGVRGAAHIGVLKALHEANIRPDLISGTSAGSIVAGLYSYGYTPQELAIIANEISRNYIDVDTIGVFMTLINVVCNAAIPISGLIKGNILEKYFVKLTKGSRMQTAKIRTAITAVDINNTNIVVFTSTPTRFFVSDDYKFVYNAKYSDAIRASIAIPGIFQPKIYNNMRLVDGGIRANLPVDIIRRMGARKVIAVNLGYGGYPMPGVDNILEISLQAIDLMIYHITIPSIKSADIIITPTMDEAEHSNLNKMNYFIECGYKTTKKLMPSIMNLMSM